MGIRNEMCWREMTTHELIMFGRRYRINVVLKSDELNPNGNIMDSYKIKEIIDQSKTEDAATSSAISRIVYNKLQKGKMKVRIRVYDGSKSSEYGDRL